MPDRQPYIDGAATWQYGDAPTEHDEVDDEDGAAVLFPVRGRLLVPLLLLLMGLSLRAAKPWDMASGQFRPWKVA